MSPRFFLILALLTAALLAWTYVHYQYEDSRQFRLEQLSELPFYVYMDDVLAMDSLAVDLFTQVPQIDSLAKEEGEVAARELLQEYQLGIESNTLREYDFPNIMTLTFKPTPASFAGREKVLELLKQHNVPEADIDSQESAWTLVKNELDYLARRWSNSTLFVALLFFLMFLFARLYLFLVEVHHPQGTKFTILESIRASETKKWHSGLLLAVPLIINLALWFILRAAGFFQPLIGWTFFLVQFCTLLAATVVAVLLDSMRSPLEEGAAHSITVTEPGRYEG